MLELLPNYSKHQRSNCCGTKGDDMVHNEEFCFSQYDCIYTGMEVILVISRGK
jgi:hypothetical protein